MMDIRIAFPITTAANRADSPNPLIGLRTIGHRLLALNSLTA
jgi:hypothetical protein